MIYDFLIAPFADFEFMRRALVGTFALALGAAPIGVFLMLRRMSLIGDAMAHAILPGAAIGFMVAGLSLFAMAGGGLIAGLVVALGAGLIARSTQLKEDASLAAFFLISLALGVTIVSVKGTNVDLLHFLFGSVLAVDDPTLLLIVGITSVSLIILALIWRPLVLECVDPGFLRSVSRAGGPAHIAFLALVVMNLVGGFQALGRRCHLVTFQVFDCGPVFPHRLVGRGAQRRHLGFRLVGGFHDKNADEMHVSLEGKLGLPGLNQQPREILARRDLVDAIFGEEERPTLETAISGAEMGCLAIQAIKKGDIRPMALQDFVKTGE